MADDDKILAALDRMTARFDGIDARFDGIDSRFDDLEKRMADGFASQASVIGELWGDVTHLGENVTKIQDDIAQIREDAARTRGALMGKLERIDNTMTVFREEVTVALGSTALVNDKFASLREEMQTMSQLIIVTQQQVRRLQARMDAADEQDGSARGV